MAEEMLSIEIGDDVPLLEHVSLEAELQLYHAALFDYFNRKKYASSFISGIYNKNEIDLMKDFHAFLDLSHEYAPLKSQIERLDDLNSGDDTPDGIIDPLTVKIELLKLHYFEDQSLFQDDCSEANDFEGALPNLLEEYYACMRDVWGNENAVLVLQETIAEHSEKDDAEAQAKIKCSDPTRWGLLFLITGAIIGILTMIGFLELGAFFFLGLAAPKAILFSIPLFILAAVSSIFWIAGLLKSKKEELKVFLGFPGRFFSETDASLSMFMLIMTANILAVLGAGLALLLLVTVGNVFALEISFPSLVFERFIIMIILTIASTTELLIGLPLSVLNLARLAEKTIKENNATSLPETILKTPLDLAKEKLSLAKLKFSAIKEKIAKKMAGLKKTFNKLSSSFLTEAGCSSQELLLENAGPSFWQKEDSLSGSDRSIVEPYDPDEEFFRGADSPKAKRMF